MDAVSLDYMLSEYQEKVEEANEELVSRKESPKPSDSARERVVDYETEVGSAETVPAADQTDSGASEVAFDVIPRGKNSSTSSSHDSSGSNDTAPSFYLPSVMSPKINYEREFPAQKLVAVFGRQFDGPDAVAQNLQRLVSEHGLADVPTLSPSAKFVPFTMKRKTLLKGSYSSTELLKHDLICMCYNASEARILLTGVDGFYSSLLKHVERVLGESQISPHGCHSFIPKLLYEECLASKSYHGINWIDFK